MKILWSGDLFVKIKNKIIALDPHRKNLKTDVTLVSHAHSDHTSGFRNTGKIISSKETYEVFKTRTSEEITNRIELNYNQNYEEKNFSITNYDSGHVLGSSQFKLQDQKQTILFTSDLNCVESLTLKAAEPINADILIIESTYGKPQYIFPSREEIYSDIAEWAVSQINEEKIPVFKAYSFGKSQEIIRILNRYLKIPILVDNIVYKISEIYNKNGINLRFSNLNEEKSKKNIKEKNCALVVCSGGNIPKNIKPLDLRLAFTSGWALKYKPKTYSASFPLSSHADYYQLLEYIKECSAKKIYTLHGYAKELAHSINRVLGISASAISNLPQRNLTDYIN